MKYRKIPKISPSMYKPPKIVTQKTLRGRLVLGNCPQIQNKTKKPVNFLPRRRLAKSILKRKFPSVHKPLTKGLWKKPRRPGAYFRNFTVIDRYNWWSYHFSAVFPGFQIVGTTQRDGSRKKKQGGGVGSESWMTITGLPHLALSLLILFCSMTWRHTPLSERLDQAPLNSTARCFVVAVLQLTYFSNPWLFNSSTHFCVKWSILSSR